MYIYIAFIQDTNYRTRAGVEIDFVVETARRQATSKPHVVAIEVKRPEKWNRSWEEPLLHFADTPAAHVDRMIGVYTGTYSYRYERVDVFPAGFQALHVAKVSNSNGIEQMPRSERK